MTVYSGLRFWNRVSGIYDLVMKKSRPAYAQMYALIRARLTPDMRVLELATGTGLIALAVADSAKSIEATDFSPAMIAAARKKPAPANVSFSVQDACRLPYADGSFDCAIISNALHIMPDPAAALHSIRRVLKPGGLLIAPTFVHAENDLKGKISARVMALAGFKLHHSWKAVEYQAFLEENGFSVRTLKVLASDFPLAYIEAENSPFKPM